MPLQGRAYPDVLQHLGGWFQLTVHLQQWSRCWEISRSCCERNLITCLLLLNNNEFLLQTNPLWNFNYSVKAVICPCKDRAVSVKPGKWSALRFLQRIPMTLNSSLWFFPCDWLWIYSGKCWKPVQCFCNSFYATRGSNASKTCFFFFFKTTKPFKGFSRPFKKKKTACTQQPTRHLTTRLRYVFFFTSLCGMFFMLSWRPILWELLGDRCILIASVFREMMGATNELCWSLTYYSLPQNSPIWSLKRKMVCKWTT